MEEVKKKRGRPRKNPVSELPEEIESLVNEVQEKQQQLEEKTNELHEKKNELYQEYEKINSERLENISKYSKSGEWDVKIGDEIKYFDKRLSYEITGYRPITEVEGLDEFELITFLIVNQVDNVS